jgi:hypothetical protein
MFPELTKEIDLYLDKALKLVDTEGDVRANRQDIFARLMEEDESIAQKRVELRGRKEKFDKALETIKELERQSGIVSDDVSEELTPLEPMEVDGEYV